MCGVRAWEAETGLEPTPSYTSVRTVHTPQTRAPILPLTYVFTQGKDPMPALTVLGALLRKATSSHMFTHTLERSHMGVPSVRTVLLKRAISKIMSLHVTDQMRNPLKSCQLSA